VYDGARRRRSCWVQIRYSGAVLADFELMADAGEALAADYDWLFDEDVLADGGAINQPASARPLQRISRTSAVLDAAGIACARPLVMDSRGWCCCSRPAGTSG
jgi:hypothetical protein